MKKKVDLSPSMVVALVALAVAMSGTALAAKTELAKNSVGSAQIKPNAVTSSDVKNGGVKGSDIGAGAVTSTALAPGSVESGALAPAAVDASTLAPGAVIPGSVAPGAIGSTALAANAVTKEKLGPKAVGPEQISPGSVESAALAPGAVIPGAVAPGAIGSTALAANAVTKEKLGPKAVGPEQIAPGSVESAALAPEAVTQAKLGESSVGPEQIVPHGIGALLLANNAVTGPALANGAVGTENLSSSIPAASATTTQDQVIPFATNTKIVFDAERFDTRNMHTNTGADNIKVFAPVDGVYLVTGSIQWEFPGEDAMGATLLGIERNSETTIASAAQTFDTHNARVVSQAQSASTATVLKAGEYVEMNVLQTGETFPGPTPEALTALHFADAPELTLVWIAPGPE